MRRILVTVISWLPMVMMAATIVPRSAAAQCSQPLAMSGQTNLACIDVDGNGVLDSADCCLTGASDLLPVTSGPSLASLCLSAQQGSSTPKIRGCQSDNYSGEAMLDLPNGMGSAQLFNGALGAFLVNFGLTMGSPPPPPFGPLNIEQASAFKGITPGTGLGSGMLVRDLDLALRVTVQNGMMMQFGSSKKHSGGIDWQCFLVPFPLTGSMIPFQMFDLCLPLDPDGNAVLTFAGQPNTRFVRFPFGSEVGPAAPAPALTRGGLIVALLALMLIGGLRIRRWIETA